ncbi:hypothetical protein NL676_030868 [Syzygium grande]|nr:hypothetical protein NL676_030868 [Syzygium grande]
MTARDDLPPVAVGKGQSVRGALTCALTGAGRGQGRVGRVGAGGRVSIHVAAPRGPAPGLSWGPGVGGNRGVGKCAGECSELGRTDFLFRLLSYREREEGKKMGNEKVKTGDGKERTSAAPARGQANVACSRKGQRSGMSRSHPSLLHHPDRKRVDATGDHNPTSRSLSQNPSGAAPLWPGSLSTLASPPDLAMVLATFEVEFGFEARHGRSSSESDSSAKGDPNGVVVVVDLVVVGPATGRVWRIFTGFECAVSDPHPTPHKPHPSQRLSPTLPAYHPGSPISLSITKRLCYDKRTCLSLEMDQ